MHGVELILTTNVSCSFSFNNDFHYEIRFFFFLNTFINACRGNRFIILKKNSSQTFHVDSRVVRGIHVNFFTFRMVAFRLK